MAKKSNMESAAAEFAKRWAGKGYEKGETSRFWLDLLNSVYGVANPTTMIEFEVPVKTITKEKGSDFIDAYISSTKVLIEQKGSKIDLSAKAKQSDGAELTPYQQGRRYAAGLPVSMTPRWIVACNFNTFEIHDMERPNYAPEVVRLEDLDKEFYRLSFLVDDTAVHTKKELEVSMAAGAIIGKIFDAFRKEYRNPEDPHSQRSLNILCVRLVFCLYAEDAGLFDSHSQFHDYLIQFKPGSGDMRKALLELFDVLNTPVKDRDPYLRDDLLAFPYVNGGLFAEKDIEVPRFTEEIADLLLVHASDDFDWSQISPTIFGGVFESTLNPETRRKGGMHYTSIENIHKVIDPLFLDDLKAELAGIKAEPQERKRVARAKEFQDKIASLKFLDPAAGSGNFLTETFLSLRRLENEAIRIIYKGQMIIGDFVNPIKVSIGQMYGIEINDFAVSVAMTALWIAEAQMMAETEKFMQISLDFLPLKSYTNIHEGNALRMDWEEVVPASELNYVMGNPPWVGKSFQTAEQKADMAKVFVGVKNYGNLDYVASWYKKAIDYLEGNFACEIAYVSTNSICQGIAVSPLWKHIFERGYVINFAYPTFKWNSEANDKAAVHCVIVGIGKKARSYRYIYPVGKEDSPIAASNINAYLMDAPSIIIDDIHTPVSDVPLTAVGSFPTDGGYLVIKAEERDAFLKNEPLASPYVKLFIGPEEFINNKLRYCLWLKDCSPVELRKMPSVIKRLEGVREFRLGSSKKQTQKRADTPHLFAEIRQPVSDYLLFPRTSSERRAYLPIGFMSADVIAGDTIIVPIATVYHFGVLESVVHMAWMRVLCGRMKSDYRYSGTLIYNNFPWPQLNEQSKKKIEQTAQSILDARALYPDSSLADLYDDLTMPVELRKAHRANDAAVMEAYGFRKDMTEPEIVAELFKMYQKLTSKE